MARTISVAAIQASYGMDLDANIKKTADFIREAASQGLPRRLVLGRRVRGEPGADRQRRVGDGVGGGLVGQARPVPERPDDQPRDDRHERQQDDEQRAGGGRPTQRNTYPAGHVPTC